MQITMAYEEFRQQVIDGCLAMQKKGLIRRENGKRNGRWELI